LAEVVVGHTARKGFLDHVERLGNALPDPVLIFVGMIVVLMGLSVVGAALGWSAVNPVTGESLRVASLMSETNLRRLFMEMPRTFTGFPPLGTVLTIVLGAAVASGSGFLTALLRASLGGLRGPLLVPVVFVIGLLSTHASDAANLVYVPLAGITFAAAGRHPVLGLITAFCGAGVGLAGNLLPGQYDVLILGITETGARLIDPSWTMNPLGNWWFSIGITVVFTGLAWIVLERVAAPRLGPWRGNAGATGDAAASRLTAAERGGLAAAGVAAVAVVALIAALALWPGFTPLLDRSTAGSAALTPLFRSLPAALFVLFVTTGWVYGARAGTITSHRDVAKMMADGLEPMLPYLVLVFFAAHFVAMFGWSNLGPIAAIVSADQLRALQAPPAILLPLLATMSAWLDFLIASGSAKWAAMAPVAAPMLMLLGISPEMTTAAYRVGDTVTNLISPLNPYVVLTLVFCRRWVPDFRMGSLLATTLPVAAAFYVGGMLLTAAWVALGLPVGPGAGVSYDVGLP
jgi:aminobenzoyl-glutamate transport protein